MKKKPAMNSMKLKRLLNDKRLMFRIILVIAAALIIFAMFSLTDKPDDTEITQEPDDSVSEAVQVSTAIQKPMTKKLAVIRETAVAGLWYPEDKATVIQGIEIYFNNIKDTELDNVKALIVPHAGWQFSGHTAATAYKPLKDVYKTVILMGPSHHVAFEGASIPNVTHYDTPLGYVHLSAKADSLLSEPLFQSHPTAHDKEHSLEIQLPFLQYKLSDYEIIPILIGSQTSNQQVKEIAATLEKYIDDSTLIVVSSDFTHYGESYGYVPFVENIHDNILKLDSLASDYIFALDPDGFLDYCNLTAITICGKYPIAILLNILGDKSVKVDHLWYDTSGQMLGEFSRSVSYLSFAFIQHSESEQQTLSDQEKNTLLKLARDKIESLYSDKKMNMDDYDLTLNLKKVQGCFTTLNKNNNLRGCIGHILPQEELYKCVIDNAENAALHDARFNPVSEDELGDIEIEISVLSVPEKLEFSSGDDLKNKLSPLVDGVVLKNSFYQSTYLPQVWEQISDKEQFLTQLCIKGGMSDNCWQDTSTEVYTYQANVFDEHDLS